MTAVVREEVVSRKPSDATRLRAAKRVNADLEKTLAALRIELSQYRGRAGKAELEVVEWKKRFDLLLAREPSNGEATR